MRTSDSGLSFFGITREKISPVPGVRGKSSRLCCRHTDVVDHPSTRARETAIDPRRTRKNTHGSPEAVRTTPIFGFSYFRRFPRFFCLDLFSPLPSLSLTLSLSLSLALFLSLFLPQSHSFPFSSAFLPLFNALRSHVLSWPDAYSVSSSLSFSLFLPRIHTHTHTLSLSLSLCLSFVLSLSHTPFLFLSLFLVLIIR